MTRKQALVLVQQAMAPTLKKLAFGANLYDAGIRAPFAIKAFKERQKISQAMEVLATSQASFL